MVGHWLEVLAVDHVRGSIRASYSSFKRNCYPISLICVGALRKSIEEKSNLILAVNISLLFWTKIYILDLFSWVALYQEKNKIVYSTNNDLIGRGCGAVGRVSTSNAKRP